MTDVSTGTGVFDFDGVELPQSALDARAAAKARSEAWGGALGKRIVSLVVIVCIGIVVFSHIL